MADAAKKVPVTVYLEPRQHRALRAITRRTGVPWALLIRKSIDLFLYQREAERPRKTQP